MAKAWYIDAWCVLDGLAFASLRSPGGLDADATIYLSPPYFEPENVGSIATALAATRGPFQAGFFSGRDAAEIGFASIELVVDAVRRAYRCGGAGDTPRGGTPVTPTASPGPNGAHFALATSGILAKAGAWNELADLLGNMDPERTHERALEQMLGEFYESKARLWSTVFVGNVVAALLSLSVSAAISHRFAALIRGWLSIARRLGIEVSGDRELVLEQRGVRVGLALDGPRWWVVREARAAGDADPAEIVPDILFETPVPRSWQDANWKSTDRLPPPATLGGLLCLATGDRLFLEGIKRPAQLLPITVAACVHIASTRPRWALSNEATRESNRLAAQWLVRALPTTQLLGHPAEAAIHEMNLRRLEALWKGPAADVDPDDDVTITMNDAGSVPSSAADSETTSYDSIAVSTPGAKMRRMGEGEMT